MFRRILLAAAAICLASAPVVFAPATAGASVAANPACATRAEFNRIHPGQTVRTTQRIIGSRGKVTMAGSLISQRQWAVCGQPYNVLTVTYLQGRVDNKIMF
jgi:hypothetical protein